jgi:hypothetical protein
MSLNLNQEARGFLIGEGFNGTVWRVMNPGENGEEPDYRVYKIFDRVTDADIQDLNKLHALLRSLPHAEEYTLSFLDYRDARLYMPDLSVGGKNLVVSINDDWQKVLQRVGEIKQKDPHFIPNFIAKINGSSGGMDWESEFQGKIELIAQELAGVHISVTGESILLTIHPDGDYQLIIEDYDNVRLKENDLIEELYKNNLEELSNLQNIILRLWLTLKKDITLSI